MTIFKNEANAADPDERVADFSNIPSDALAQLSVDVWGDPNTPNGI